LEAGSLQRDYLLSCMCMLLGSSVYYQHTLPFIFLLITVSSSCHMCFDLVDWMTAEAVYEGGL